MKNELEKMFSQTLNIQVPIINHKQNTIFDIAKISNDEETISNFYSYYLNPNESHSFGTLFVKTLENIIKEKSNNEFSFDSYLNVETKRECVTKQNKFIDIVVKEISNRYEPPKNAVIIENKVNAPLYNDLDHYLESIIVTNKKIGVVLSLKTHTHLPKDFISITHQEFLTKIEESYGPYTRNAKLTDFIILREFIDNLLNMTTKSKLPEHYSFFLENKQKLAELSTLYAEMKNDIFQKVEQALEKLDLGLKISAKTSPYFRYYSPQDGQVYFTIWMKDYFEGTGPIQIIVELDRDGIKFIEQINAIEFSKEETILLRETHKIRPEYLHYAAEDWNPQINELINLESTLSQKILNSSLMTIFAKIKKRIQEFSVS